MIERMLSSIMDRAGVPPELPDLLSTRTQTPSAWLKLLYIAGAVVCFALGIVGWLVPLVTGVPFYFAGIALLGLASDRVRRLINRAERKLPYEWRSRLRRALRRVPGRLFADVRDEA
jgi:hypothetical protein